MPPGSLRWPWGAPLVLAGAASWSSSAGASEPPKVDEEVPTATPLPKKLPEKLEIDPEALERFRKGLDPSKLPGLGKKMSDEDRKRLRAAALLRRQQLERATAAVEARLLLRGKPLPPAYREELERHARRIADIERVIEVARGRSDAATTKRARALLTRENARHRSWLRRYKARVETKTADEPEADDPKPEGDDQR